MSQYLSYLPPRESVSKTVEGRLDFHNKLHAFMGQVKHYVKEKDNATKEGLNVGALSMPQWGLEATDYMGRLDKDRQTALTEPASKALAGVRHREELFTEDRLKYAETPGFKTAATALTSQEAEQTKLDIAELRKQTAFVINNARNEESREKKISMLEGQAARIRSAKADINAEISKIDQMLASKEKVIMFNGEQVSADALKQRKDAIWADYEKAQKDEERLDAELDSIYYGSTKPKKGAAKPAAATETPAQTTAPATGSSFNYNGASITVE